MRLQGKVVVITGAAGAIGSITARAMAAEGASLALVDLDDARMAHQFTDLDPARTVRIAADVSQEAGNRQVAETVLARFGAIDGFFANAGIEGEVAAMGSYPESTWDRVMAVNVKSIFFGVQQLVPKMRDGGSVIMTSSIMGLAGAHRNIAYTASKHAVVGLMRSAAREAAPRGIRVNTVNPGIVESPMVRRLISQHADPAAHEKLLRSGIKLGRFVQPEDIAHAVVFLASDESRNITSQTFLIDGGMLD
jgi:NAD(P)-dependent dehydrogenase (short-subunit alcohol dehydrogenase family)